MLRRYVVINSKGGCGKTTLASNLASYFATRGYKTALIDHDPQRSSFHWLKKRSADHAKIHGVVGAGDLGAKITRSFQLRVPEDTQRVIVDTPAAMKKPDLVDVLRSSNAIIVPVLPSSIDSHVTVNFVRELQMITRQSAIRAPIALVANRVRKNVRAYGQLEEALEELGIPLLTSLRDAQVYVDAAEQGVGIHDLEAKRLLRDRFQWLPIVHWLENSGKRPTRQELHYQSQQAQAY